MPSRTLRLIPLLLALAACHGASRPADEPEPVQVPTRPLAQLAAQRVIVTPAFSLVTGDAMGWATAGPRSREMLRQLDSAIVEELEQRGLKSQWYFTADLVRSAKASPTYAVDPYSLGVNVLRGAGVESGSRVGDPLATQLRTMVAMQEGARAVLVPVELRFEKEKSSGQGVAALRVALMDGRLGDVRWIGTVRSAPSATYSRAVLASVAAHLADLITAP